MNTKENFIHNIKNPIQQNRMKDITHWIESNHSYLDSNISWYELIYTLNNHFAIGFKISDHHISISTTPSTMKRLNRHFKQIGYIHSTHLFRIHENQTINYDIFEKIIQINTLS